MRNKTLAHCIGCGGALVGILLMCIAAWLLWPLMYDLALGGFLAPGRLSLKVRLLGIVAALLLLVPPLVGGSLWFGVLGSMFDPDNYLRGRERMESVLLGLALAFVLTIVTVIEIGWLGPWYMTRDTVDWNVGMSTYRLYEPDFGASMHDLSSPTKSIVCDPWKYVVTKVGRVDGNTLKLLNQANGIQGMKARGTWYIVKVRVQNITDSDRHFEPLFNGLKGFNQTGLAIKDNAGKKSSANASLPWNIASSFAFKPYDRGTIDLAFDVDPAIDVQ